MDRRGRPVELVAIRWRVRDWRFLKSGVVILLLLAFLAADILAFVANALALIRFGTAVAADFGGNLADQLLVHARHADLGGLFRGDGDAGGDRIGHIVAEAELQVQILALHSSTIADALDFQLLGETRGDAGDQIVDQAAGQDPHLGGTLLVLVGRDGDAVLVHLRGDFAHQLDAEFALGTFDLDGLALDRGGNALGQRDRFLANTRHGFGSLKHLAENFAADILFAG